MASGLTIRSRRTASPPLNSSVRCAVSSVEFAPEYSRAERVRFVVRWSAIGGLLVLACRLWFFPWLHQFSASAHCRSIFGVSGTVVLLYGAFVGIPLFACALVGVLVGWRGYKVVRQGRIPPAGEKVFRPTRVVRGAKAKLLGFLQLSTAALPFLLAVWGSFQAHSLAAQAERAPARCAPNPSIERTSLGWPRQP